MTKWFETWRSLAISIALCRSSLGQFILVPVVMRIISQVVFCGDVRLWRRGFSGRDPPRADGYGQWVYAYRCRQAEVFDKTMAEVAGKS